MGPPPFARPDGKPVGSVHANSALDTCIYKVHFPDGGMEELAANVIAEAVYAQCDANSNQYVLLDTIMDYRKNPSVAVSRMSRLRSLMAKRL